VGISLQKLHPTFYQDQVFTARIKGVTYQIVYPFCVDDTVAQYCAIKGNATIPPTVIGYFDNYNAAVKACDDDASKLPT
jgi:hypothetical protein